jgi:signal transduction histidine kinase
VFSNLISNAVRYSADVKDITVRFSLDGGRLKCSVIDKGIGIAPEDLESIWNRYQRASKSATRSHASGTGLGLSIAKEILERHGADYGVESEVGKGSIFWFTIKAKFIVDSTIT